MAGTRYNARGYDVRLEVLGSAGQHLASGSTTGCRCARPSRGSTFPAGSPYPVFMDRFQRRYVAELTAFVEVAAGRLPSPCTVADALEAFYVAEACELSRREHRPVRVDEVRR